MDYPIDQICEEVKAASSKLAQIDDQTKNYFLSTLSQNLIKHQGRILSENKKDLQFAKEHRLSDALIDRLQLTSQRIQSLSDSLYEITGLPDPVGEVVRGGIRPNGLKVFQVRVPLGVVMVIFESRPNVTIDIAALCIKSGNAVILRGGKEARHSNQVLGEVITESLKETGLPEKSVYMVSRQEHEVVELFLKKKDKIDLVIPRGGETLINRVVELSSIPVVKHDKGICHLYLEEDAPRDRAIEIALNGKVQRPGVCNAIETLLVHEKFPFLKEVLSALVDQGVELRLDEVLSEQFPQYRFATEEDWSTEYLDLILSVKRVSDLEEAVSWINHYGSKHTEVIVTENLTKANYFVQQVDASAVIVNASSRFNDGSMLGLGGEVGISTQKLHVRGPMGIRDLTCLKYQIEGSGQVRS